MANSRESRLLFARLYSAGISLRAVRSPVAPKITMTQGPLGGGAADPPWSVSSRVSSSAKSPFRDSRSWEVADKIRPRATAVRAARSGQPYLLEVITERLRGHSVVDPAKYRSAEEVERLKHRCDKEMGDAGSSDASGDSAPS